jgi:16S rRNA (uracil1498-N3)-methyltransferase
MLPFFYTSQLPVNKLLTLDENNSRHAIQVLRMRTGSLLNITDGLGNIYKAQITAEHKKNCTVAITDTQRISRPQRQINIGISLLKNTSRFEWFLEKATEMGIAQIMPLVCSRTEKQQFKTERLQGILQSAMLQSQQAWLPVMQAPQSFGQIVKSHINAQKLIAHCYDDDSKQPLFNFVKNNNMDNTTILIGPEGDFTNEELEQAKQNGYTTVSLGNTRLRTETAGMLAVALLVQ